MVAPAVESVAVSALRALLHCVRRAAEQAGRHGENVRAVAVGKTKPISLINQVYDASHCCFGENYVQEIIEKAPRALFNARFEQALESQSLDLRSYSISGAIDDSSSLFRLRFLQKLNLPENSFENSCQLPIGFLESLLS